MATTEGVRIPSRGHQASSFGFFCTKKTHLFHMVIFSDIKKHKPPIFSREIGGLRLLNLAVKVRFELLQRKRVSDLRRNLQQYDYDKHRKKVRTVLLHNRTFSKYDRNLATDVL